mgnify:CR=1 FL=1
MSFLQLTLLYCVICPFFFLFWNMITYTNYMWLDSYITAVDISEIGKVVAAVAKDWEKYRGKFIPVAGDHMHPQEYVRIIREVTGLNLEYVKVSWDKYREMAGDELCEMMRYVNVLQQKCSWGITRVGLQLVPGVRILRSKLWLEGRSENCQIDIVLWMGSQECRSSQT